MQRGGRASKCTIQTDRGAVSIKLVFLLRAHPSWSLTFTLSGQTCVSSPPTFALDMSSLLVSAFCRWHTFGVFVPPLLPEFLIFLPLGLFHFPLFPPFIHRREPLFSRGILLSLCGIEHHAVIHGLLLFPAHYCGGECS